MNIILISIFSFAFVACSGSGGQFSPCTDEIIVREDDFNTQHSIAFNSRNGEYFVVYIEQLNPGQTSVVGLRIGTNGIVIASIDIYPYSRNPHQKKNPQVVYNSNRGTYLVLFEYDVFGDQRDWDVAASPLDGQGKNLTAYPYLIVGLDGDEANTAVTYNSNADQFFAVFDYFPPNSTNANIVNVIMDGTGLPTVYISVGSSYNDTNPSIAFNPHLNNYLFAIEIDTGADTDIWGLFVDSRGNIDVQNPAPIGTWYFRNGSQYTSLDEQNPIVIYSPVQRNFIVTTELDLQGIWGIEQDVVALTANETTGYPLQAISFTRGVPRLGGVSVAYSSRSDDFLIVAEEDDPDVQGDEDLRAIVFDAKTLATEVDLQKINQNTRQEFNPQVSYSTAIGEFMVLWNSGNKPARSQSIAKEKETQNAFSLRSYLHQDSTTKIPPSFSVKTITPNTRKIEDIPTSIRSSKIRRDAFGDTNIIARALCSPATSTTGTTGELPFSTTAGQTQPHATSTESVSTTTGSEKVSVGLPTVAVVVIGGIELVVGILFVIGCVWVYKKKKQGIPYLELHNQVDEADRD